ncbi:MAG: hypothetical protein IJ125_02115 [Atopobiaceae bacterium]|nr:hypothetical protein [Atopobiaceae bacterium]
MGTLIQDEKGTYRWVYEFNLWTNPTILITVLKVFVISCLILTAFMFALLIPDLIDGMLYSWQVEGTFRIGVVVLAVMVGLSIIGYAIYAILMGGKYCAVFEMDKTKIVHSQMPKQFEKVQLIGAITALVGLASGKPSQAGIGLLTAARSSSTSTFAAVRSIKGSRTLHVIKVNEALMKNQVYVEPEDYDFVFNYIVEHCPNAKVKG